MENNKKESELAKLLKEKKYEEAVDLVLGKEGSENDISGTNKFGILSAIGREGLLEVFTKGNFYGPPGQGKLRELRQYSEQFNLVQDMVINERIATNDFPTAKLSPAILDRFKHYNVAEDVVTNHPSSKKPLPDLSQLTEENVAEMLAQLKPTSEKDDFTPFTPNLPSISGSITNEEMKAIFKNLSEEDPKKPMKFAEHITDTLAKLRGTNSDNNNDKSNKPK